MRRFWPQTLLLAGSWRRLHAGRHWADPGNRVH